MGEDKDLQSRGNAAQSSENEGAAPSRARNKTVMLSPEMTGQVRAMLNDAPASGGSGSNPAVGQGKQSLDDYLPPLVDWGNVGKPAAAPSTAATQEGFIRAKGAPDGFSALDALSDTSAPPSLFDPLTSVAPSVTHGGSRGETSRDLPKSDPAPFGFGQSEPQNALSGFSLNQPAPRGQTPLSSQPLPMSQPMTPPPAALSQHAVLQPPPVQPAFTQPVAQPAQTIPAAAQPAPKPQRAARPANWHAIVSNTGGESAKLVGLFVSYDRVDSGEIFEVRAGRFLITSRPTDNGDYLLVEDESVSPLHAIVRATKEGAIQVLDQLSEFGTGVVRGGVGEEDEISGGLATIQHGDVVRFGKRTFVTVAIPQTRPGKAS